MWGTAAWARQAIETLTARDMVQGMGNGFYEPQHGINRSEFTGMVLKALELKAKADTGTTFSDVPADAWYAAAAAAAEEQRIVSGGADGSFGQGDSLTREEMAVIACRALRAARPELDTGSGVSFRDAGQISGYAAQAVSLLGGMGIACGYHGGEFRPRALATRAEAAAIVLKLLEQ